MNSNKAPSTVSLVVSMPLPERLFLWAIRAWSASHTDLTAVWWSLDRAFSQERIPTALPPFHELMSALFAGWRRWPDICCVVCPHVGRDEARLLRMLGCLQYGDEAGARVLLNELALRFAARVAHRHAAECVAIASAAGLHFIAPKEKAPAISRADWRQGHPLHASESFSS